MPRTAWSEDEEFSGDDVDYPSWKKDWQRRGRAAEAERLAQLEKLENEILYRKGMAACHIRRRRAVLTAKRLGHPRIDRRAVYERDGGICQLCGLPTAFEMMELDHVRPIARGGSHTLENVQTSHRACNRHKSANLHWEPPL